ncbi:hypothetical protein [Actinoplanes teichomyceticus]|uniref:Uncharacterized protein n=1 Tax=Actinoplanes teichomyceticus TaxID=1867 RepID=A0A561VIQ2_ACTTI|nr:hypothetical protein [Actinoplanes teichomyceticus]TWG11489.1 hypothetical protein FHX34_106219 [Actinoplanes teichomyceticus]GIF15697.1 hypothetical protein Ate01nite_57290 [Actinoplanes teichomyceticus]
MTAPPDPLRLCVYATVAALTWWCGPVAVVFFAGLALAGYLRAHRQGLRRSACLLRDVRVVLAYLAVLLLAGLAGALRSWWT